MSTPTLDLIEHAKKCSRESHDELTEPDADIPPVLLFLGPQGFGMMPLGQLFENDDSKDEGTLWMTASLAVAQAVSAVMVTTAYMGIRDKDAEGVNVEDETVDKPIREWPDRIECIVLMCSDEKGDRMISAPITRYEDKPPTLGEWDEGEYADRMGGRFGNAINLGLRIVKEMPDEMREIIDEGWREGKPEELIERFVNVARSFTGPPRQPGQNAHVHVLADPPVAQQVAGHIMSAMEKLVGPSFDPKLMEAAIATTGLTLEQIAVMLTERRFDELRELLEQAKAKAEQQQAEQAADA